MRKVNEILAYVFVYLWFGWGLAWFFLEIHKVTSATSFKSFESLFIISFLGLFGLITYIYFSHLNIQNQMRDLTALTTKVAQQVVTENEVQDLIAKAINNKLEEVNGKIVGLSHDLDLTDEQVNAITGKVNEAFEVIGEDIPVESVAATDQAPVTDPIQVTDPAPVTDPVAATQN